MSESTKFNLLFTGSIFLVSKLYTNRKDISKSHATAKSSFVLFCFVLFFFWGGGARPDKTFPITAKLL